MPAALIAAAIIGIAGVAIALTLATVRQMSSMPRPPAGEEEWPYTAVDYLWWDEGIYWAAR